MKIIKNLINSKVVKMLLMRLGKVQSLSPSKELGKKVKNLSRELFSSKIFIQDILGG